MDPHYLLPIYMGSIIMYSPTNNNISECRLFYATQMFSVR